MNTDIFEGKWKQFKGSVKDQWGKLTDDDIDRVEGNWEKFEGTLQERYGWKKDEAKREWDNWISTKK